MKRKIILIPAVACGAAAALVSAQAPQQQAAPAQNPAQNPAAQASAPTESQQRAREILMRMAAFMAGSPNFSVNVASNYDVLQASGQKIEFGERRSVLVNRPNRLRVDTERSDGTKTSAVFTGSELVLVDASHKVYATEPQAGNLDESILHFVSDLGMRFPLAALLMSRLPLEFERRVRSIDYVEQTGILGPPTHHLAARGDTVDFQVWVRDGPEPVPVRVVLTYKLEPGQPEFRAQFTDWNLAPAIAEGTFRPRIPEGATKILFTAQLAALRPPGPQGGKR
jgi:hypothetical protein